MDFWDSLGAFLLLTLEIFLLVAFLMVLWRILLDLFSDTTLSGWAKAGWIFLLIFLPVLGALIYLIARGRGMTERTVAQAQAAQNATDQYIRQTSMRGSATELESAKRLLDSGTITQEEFNKIKAEVVGS